MNACNTSGSHHEALAAPGGNPSSPSRDQSFKNCLKNDEKELEHSLGKEIDTQTEVTHTPPYSIGALVDYVAQHDHARHMTEPLWA